MEAKNNTEKRTVYALVYYLPGESGAHELLGFYETEQDALEVKNIIYDKNDPNYRVEEWSDDMPF